MSFTRRKLLASLGGLAATAGLSAIWASRMTTYDGPVSDHFDGTTFYDADGMAPKSLADVLRWQFGGGRERSKWPDWLENEHADTPPAVVETGDARIDHTGSTRIFWPAVWISQLAWPTKENRILSLPTRGGGVSA